MWIFPFKLYNLHFGNLEPKNHVCQKSVLSYSAYSVSFLTLPVSIGPIERILERAHPLQDRNDKIIRQISGIEPVTFCTPYQSLRSNHSTRLNDVSVLLIFLKILHENRKFVLIPEEAVVRRPPIESTSAAHLALISVISRYAGVRSPARSGRRSMQRGATAQKMCSSQEDGHWDNTLDCYQ